MMASDKTYVYCNVLPANYHIPYFYICDFDVKPGDIVVITIRSTNNIKAALILDVLECTEATAPYPPELTKHILRHFGDNEPAELLQQKAIVEEEKKARFKNLGQSGKFLTKETLSKYGVGEEKIIDSRKKLNALIEEIARDKSVEIGSLTKRKYFKDKTLIRMAIEIAAAEAKERKMVFKNIEEFAQTCSNVKYDSYTDYNKKYLEIFGVDAVEYLTLKKLIPSKEAIINKLLDKYDILNDYLDFIEFVKDSIVRESQRPKDEYSYIWDPEVKYAFDKSGKAIHVIEEFFLRITEEVHIPVGDRLNFIRDPHAGEYSIRIESDGGIKLGYLYSRLKKVLSPLIDSQVAVIENGKLLSCTLCEDMSYLKYTISFDIVLDEKCCSSITSFLNDDCYETKAVVLPKKSPINFIKTEIEWCSDTSLIIHSSFGNAVFRGFRSQIEEAVKFIYSQTQEHLFGDIKKTQTPGIYELSIRNTIRKGDSGDIVGQILHKYPCLKMVAFFELDITSGYVVFSEPGYKFVTQNEFVGYMDYKADTTFVWEENPTRDYCESVTGLNTGETWDVDYKFPYFKEWNRFDYLFPAEDGFRAVKSIHLPNGIKHIDDYAYSYSDCLEKIVIPSSVSKISPHAFEGNTNVNIVREK